MAPKLRRAPARAILCRGQGLWERGEFPTLGGPCAGFPVASIQTVLIIRDMRLEADGSIGIHPIPSSTEGSASRPSRTLKLHVFRRPVICFLSAGHTPSYVP